MKELGRNELAADTNNGVYVCENSAANGEVLQDMAFYEALGNDFDGIIYGNVSDRVAKIIEAEYGIY